MTTGRAPFQDRCACHWGLPEVYLPYQRGAMQHEREVTAEGLNAGKEGPSGPRRMAQLGARAMHEVRDFLPVAL